MGVDLNLPLPLDNTCSRLLHCIFPCSLLLSYLSVHPLTVSYTELLKDCTECCVHSTLCTQYCVHSTLCVVCTQCCVRCALCVLYTVKRFCSPPSFTCTRNQVASDVSMHLPLGKMEACKSLRNLTPVCIPLLPAFQSCDILELTTNMLDHLIVPNPKHVPFTLSIRACC